MFEGKKINHFRDGLVFKAEITENKEGKPILHCECEEKKSKELYGIDFTADEIRIQTDYLVDKLEGFLKLMEVGLLGTSNECTLIIVRNQDQVVLSFSYRTEIISRDFDVPLRKFHRDEVERIATIVNDLQTDMSNLQMQKAAPLKWKDLKLMNGCCTTGIKKYEAPPSYIVHDRVMHVRGYVRLPEDINRNYETGMIIAKFPKDYFPMEYMVVHKLPSPVTDQVTFYRVDVRCNGDIYLHNPTPGGSVFLDGMTFLCEKM